MARLVNTAKKIWHGKVLRRRATDKGQSQAFMPAKEGFARFNLSGAPVGKNLRKKHAAGWAKKMFPSLPKQTAKQLTAINANKHLNYCETLLANRKILKEKLVKAQKRTRLIDYRIDHIREMVGKALAKEPLGLNREVLSADGSGYMDKLFKQLGASEELERIINSALRTIGSELAGEKTAKQPKRRKP